MCVFRRRNCLGYDVFFWVMIPFSFMYFYHIVTLTLEKGSRPLVFRKIKNIFKGKRLNFLKNLPIYLIFKCETL